MKHLTLITVLICVFGTTSASPRKLRSNKAATSQAIPLANLISSSVPVVQKSGQIAEPRNNAEKVIVVLETREYLLTVYSGDLERLYSVGTESGVPLAEKLTASELKAHFPELYDVAVARLVDSPMVDSPL
jgi:hypothetical protein